jgi:hypothetical protein
VFQARQLMTERADGVALSDDSVVSAHVRKWGSLLEGMEREIGDYAPPGQANYTKAIASFMFEAQSKHLRRLSEETRALSVGPFLKFVFPVIRRTAIRLVATSIASVQPMTGPIGGIAFYRPRYGSDKGQVAAGTEMNKSFNRFYSSNFVDGEPFGTGDGVTKSFTGALKWPPVIGGTVIVNTASNGTTALAVDAAGVFTALAGPMAGGSGTINYKTGVVTLNFGTAPVLGDAISVQYRYNNELNARIPEVQLDITIQEIQAESRKLRSLASVEAADDLRALWGRDVDADLVAQMSDEMTAEIDREIVGTVLNAVENIAVVPWDRATPSNLSDPDHLKSLVIRMSSASQLIHRRTQRAPANWCITSSEVAALLETIDGFTAIDEGHVYQGGITKAGVLNRKWVIYIDPVFPIDKILMGYQGPSILDTGIIYSPYIPMEITPNFVDPNDFSLRRAIRTRHKITMVRPEFFSMVNISNLV